MALSNDIVREQLMKKFGDQVTSFEESYGMLTFEAPRELNLKVLEFLYDDPVLQFRFLTDLCGAHYPNNQGKELSVIYHLHNLIDNIRICFKVYLPVEKPDIFTATALFASANWMERETYDFFGINFIGHPDLRRILNADEMEYFPLRKEYPVEDPKRIDKDDAMFGRGAVASSFAHPDSQDQKSSPTE